MPKIILTKGLPGCGKTTWAKEYQSKNPNTVRVNKDDLRAMLNNSVWSKGREDFVLKVRNFIVEESLKEGHDVIVDDTNLHSKHKNEMWKIAAAQNATAEIKDFTDVPIETCIERDLKRPNSVGQKVIKDMQKQFLTPEPLVVEYDATLPDAIICDLDGTLCLFPGQSPYDRDFSQDLVNLVIVDILDQYKSRARVLFTSGRKDSFRGVTQDWLNDRVSTGYELFMRKADDPRKDFIVKKELYEQNIKGKYNVLFVLDDRNQVVDLWRSLGLTCLQVAEGDF